MRDQTVDIAKGIGIFLVVLGHIVLYGSPIQHYIYLFHMPLFFFLSGLFFSPKPLKKCFFDKTLRLICPFVFYWLFNNIFRVLLAVTIYHKDLQSISISTSIGLLWFLLVLWIVSILSNVMVATENKIIFLLQRVLMSALGIALVYYSINQSVYVPKLLIQSMIMLPFFLLGNICYRCKIKGISIYTYLFGAKVKYLTFFLSFIMLAFPVYAPLDISNLIVPPIWSLLLSGLSGSFLVLSFSSIISNIMGLNAFFNKLGQKSLHIYGFHFTFLQLSMYFAIPIILRICSLIDISAGDGSTLRYHCLPLQLVCCAIAIFCGYWLGIYFERKLPICFRHKR